MRCGLKDEMRMKDGSRIPLDYTPIWEALKKAGFIPPDSALYCRDDEALYYDDGEPTPVARHCGSCEEMNHVQSLIACPAYSHRPMDAHHEVCEYCYPVAALELLGFWEDWSPDYTLDELEKLTSNQLRLLAFMKDTWITYSLAWEVVKGAE